MVFLVSPVSFLPVANHFLFLISVIRVQGYTIKAKLYRS